MSLRSRSEKVLHLHALRCRRGRQTSAFEHTEELCGRQTQYHVCKMHSNTSTRSRAQWMESLSRFAGDFVVDPARWEVARKYVIGNSEGV